MTRREVASDPARVNRLTATSEANEATTRAATIDERRTEFRAIFEDEDRFRSWYDIAARRLYRYLYGRCAGDQGLTEELTQQAFLQAISRRDAYDGRADPMTWLTAIGRNVLIDHVRRVEREERRRLRLIVREIPTAQMNLTKGPEDEREIVMSALAGMPVTQRTALVLHHVDGLSVREVATSLHRSTGAVEQLLNRGRANFRSRYREADRG